jgi:putative transcriptional regulator
MKSFCYVVNFLTEGTTANFAVAKKHFSYPQHILRKKLRSIVMNFVKSIVFLVNLVYNILRHIIDRSARMEISYKKLWILLIEKNISPATLRKDLNIATGTMTKMRRNEDVALSVLLRICEYLDCNIGDICDAVKAECK